MHKALVKPNTNIIKVTYFQNGNLPLTSRDNYAHVERDKNFDTIKTLSITYMNKFQDGIIIFISQVTEIEK